MSWRDRKETHRVISRDVSRALSEARTLEEAAEIIAASVHADLKDDARAFAQEQKAAEAKRLGHLLDGLPAPGETWFGVRPKKNQEDLAHRLRRPRRVTVAEPAVPKTPIPIADSTLIQPQSFDQPFENDEEVAKKKREQAASPSLMPRADRVDGDLVLRASIKPPAKSPPSQPMTRPPFTVVEEGHVVGRIIPTREPQAASDAGLRPRDNETAETEGRERESDTGALDNRSSASVDSASKLSRTKKNNPSAEQRRRPHSGKGAAEDSPSAHGGDLKSSAALRSACVEIASAHLRLHHSYFWLDELSVMADMDQLAFRAAVNEQTSISRQLPVDALKNRIGVLSKRFNQLARYTRPPTSRTKGDSRGFEKSITSLRPPKKDGRGS